MADNVAITAGTGTTIGADDVGGGVLHQRVKVTWGPDGTGNDTDVATGKPIPAQIRSATGLVPIGEPTDAKSTATDTTSASLIAIAKQISASVQAPPSQAVTNGGTFAAQAAVTAASGSISSGAIASGAVASGAVASGAFASGALASGSVADGAVVTLGAKADAKSTATDTTAITLMQVAKQISASVQALATAMSTNALAGEYETVAASATDQAIGASGATGDYLSHVIVIPAVAGCGLVTIKDNTTAIISFVGGGTTAMPSVAPFVIPVGLFSASGAWKITTGANVSCVAVGNFT